MPRPRADLESSSYAGSSLFREERENADEFRDDEIGVVDAPTIDAAEVPGRRGAGASGASRSGSPPRHRLSSSSSSGGASWGSWRIEGAALGGSSHSSLSSLGNHPADTSRREQSGFRTRKRETLAWAVVAAQAVVIAAFSLGYGGRGNDSSSAAAAMDAALRMNSRPTGYYERQRQRAQLSEVSAVSTDGAGAVPAPASSSSSSPYGSQNQQQQPQQTPLEPFYEPPQIHPKDAGLVERTWHSNGAPSINADLQKGSCWCSADEWCMCTPSMAVDVILRSGPDMVWMVRRADTGMLALMGGMIEVGETAEQAVHRELREEMNIVLPPATPAPALFGVYSDPLRDARRHTASIVYVVDVPLDAVPKAGDDATEVVRVALNDIDHRTFFVDHKTMLRDYRAAVGGADAGGAAAPLPLGPGGAPAGSEAAPFAPGEPVRRSVCPIPVANKAG